MKIEQHAVLCDRILSSWGGVTSATLIMLLVLSPNLSNIILYIDDVSSRGSANDFE